MEHLSIKGLHKGNLECGSFTGDSVRLVKEGFRNGASFTLQRLLEGNLDGGLLY
jgi:hypothetical protein